MFGYFGSSKDDLLMLFHALRSSAQSDPLAPNPAMIQHADGWGYVLHSGGKAQHERIIQPIFDGTREYVPPFSGTAYAIFHARQAGSHLIGNPKFQHPFKGEWEGGTIFLAHNGSMVRKRLASELGLIDTNEMVGSEAALRYILRERRRGKSLEEATTSLESFTSRNSALNVLILDIPASGKPQLLAKQFYNRDPHSKDRTEYYQFKLQKFGSGGIAVFSSTLSVVQPELKQSSVMETSDLSVISELV